MSFRITTALRTSLHTAARPARLVPRLCITSMPVAGPSRSISSKPVTSALSKRIRPSQSVDRRFSSTPLANAGEGGAGADVSPGIAITELTVQEYEDVSERDMETLYESLEILCEDFGGGEWEVEYSSGVLNLLLPPHGTYVVNKQPPNQQIWISSPISGPSRFGYHDGKWVHHRREGVTLGGLLDKELQEVMERSSLKGAWEGTGLK